MRQSNQKSRSRGRGRKPQNPMSKNFESNGPDVKIRGNASHIAEKYTTLARDAQSNGDTVMAENYYQHAEHYNRIIAIAQQQNQQRVEEAAANSANSTNGKGPQPDVEGEAAEAQVNGEATKTVEASAEESSASTGTGEEKPKRNGRARGKPKSEIAADGVEPATEKVSKPAGDDETVSVEVISDDASKLPGSIIGEPSAEEA